MTRGRFITFEGIDGAGKTTHIATFAESLRRRLHTDGKSLVVTREPGGTPLGEELRALLLHEAMHLETEALLMFAARREHLAQIIEPALARGDWVLSDRFTDASFAYQGGGRGLARAKLETLEHWVQGELRPDLTLLFDLPPELARARVAGRLAGMNNEMADKFEIETEQFFKNVRNEYLRRADESPSRFVVIDATAEISSISKVVEELSLTV